MWEDPGNIREFVFILRPPQGQSRQSRLREYGQVVVIASPCDPTANHQALAADPQAANRQDTTVANKRLQAGKPSFAALWPRGASGFVVLLCI